MIFNLGKQTKQETRGSLEARVLERWRAANNITAQGSDSDTEAQELANTSVDWPEQESEVATVSVSATNKVMDDLFDDGIVQTGQTVFGSENYSETFAEKKVSRRVVSFETNNQDLEEKASLQLKSQENRFVGKTPTADFAVPFAEDLKRRFGQNLRSALGPGTVIEGKFSFDQPVQVDGSLTGDVFSTSVLIVGEQAVVEARIRVGSLIVQGQIYGEVEATDLVEIRKGGHIEGDIFTKRIVIEDGGTFEGGCNISK